MPKTKLFALLLLIGAIGCNGIAVTTSALTGTWVMMEDSRQRLPDRFVNASPKIVLNANGTFLVSDLPGLFFEYSNSDRLYAGRGNWRLESREKKQNIQLEFHRSTGGSEDIPTNGQLDISKAGVSPILYYYVGDEDEGRKIEFIRVKQ